MFEAKRGHIWIWTGRSDGGSFLLESWLFFLLPQPACKYPGERNGPPCRRKSQARLQS